ncbi:hypothetical protein GQ602_002933 [Ophiocordyceps camponoti-floridani]|uniref:Uncharacterized protein n=1 Tax=Ophiocordyceps camponoti-floridani TaxID=2030778 RepID=A0A8H4Q7N3_9HYPO|nr:hypothetical protein GQ602_002933 [Ophiocordyceps camponoti-floridani]
MSSRDESSDLRLRSGNVDVLCFLAGRGGFGSCFWPADDWDGSGDGVVFVHSFCARVLVSAGYSSTVRLQDCRHDKS